LAASRGRDELFGLRGEDGLEEVWVDAPEGAAEPDVKEVREVGVADVVVVGRVGRDERCSHAVHGDGGVKLANTTRPAWEHFRYDTRNEPKGLIPAAGGRSERIRLCEIPSHGNGLPGEKVPDVLLRRIGTPQAKRVIQVCHSTIRER